MVWAIVLLIPALAFGGSFTDPGMQIARKKCATTRRQIATNPDRDAFGDLVVTAKSTEERSDYQLLVLHPYYAQLIEGAAKKFGLSDDEADDLHQNTFVRIKRGTLHTTDYPAQWVTTIAERLAMNVVRNRKSRRTIEYAEQCDPDARLEWLGSADKLIKSIHDRRQRQMDVEEELGVVIDAIYELPQTYREILLLEIEREDLDQKDKAEILGTSPKAYKSRLTRARIALGKDLARDETLIDD